MHNIFATAIVCEWVYGILHEKLHVDTKNYTDNLFTSIKIYEDLRKVTQI